MDFHLFGAESLRHNDLFMFDQSCIHDILVNIQEGNPLKYAIWGDSAYQHLVEEHVSFRVEGLAELTSKAMGSARETVEWNFAHLKGLFKMLDCRHALRIRGMPVVDMVKSACLLRNAYVSMNGNQTSRFFNCKPPSFEEWLHG